MLSNAFSFVSIDSINSRKKQKKSSNNNNSRTNSDANTDLRNSFHEPSNIQIRIGKRCSCVQSWVELVCVSADIIKINNDDETFSIIMRSLALFETPNQIHIPIDSYTISFLLNNMKFFAACIILFIEKNFKCLQSLLIFHMVIAQVQFKNAIKLLLCWFYKIWPGIKKMQERSTKKNEPILWCTFLYSLCVCAPCDLVG